MRGLDAGRLNHLVEYFTVSGKVLSTEWIGHLERRVMAAGGTMDEAHIIYNSFYEVRKQYEVAYRRTELRSSQEGGVGLNISNARLKQRDKFVAAMNISSGVVYTSLQQENFKENI